MLRFATAFLAGFLPALYAQFAVLPHILTINDLDRWLISILVGAIIGGCFGLEHYLVATYPWLNPFSNVLNSEITNLQTQVDQKLDVSAVVPVTSPAPEVIPANQESTVV